MPEWEQTPKRNGKGSHEATLPSPTEEELQLEREIQEHLWNEEEQREKWKRALPPDAQRRLDEHQNEYYAALWRSDESDEHEDGLGVYVPKEPIGEVCAVCLEVQSGLGEVVSICGHGISADSLASILSATLWMFKHSPVGER